ncbi:MAG: hypothetical protein M1823_001188 [Watsoniomyces obsoletus]|nr:MAG: hypothetical protein M1823_001188 [Watsoniomyces obsoletus]
MHPQWDSPQKKAYMNLGRSVPHTTRRRVSKTRARVASGGRPSSLYGDAGDHIHKDLGGMSACMPRRSTEKTTPTRPGRVGPLQTTPENLIRTAPQMRKQEEWKSSYSHDDRARPYDGPRPSPPKWRASQYVTNRSLPTPPPGVKNEVAADDDASFTPTKDGMEIRSVDICEATRMRRKDRSPKLPMPAFVSDRRDRPIVSFDPHWKPAEEEPPPVRSNSNEMPPASDTRHRRTYRDSPQATRGGSKTIIVGVTDSDDGRVEISRGPAITITDDQVPSVPTINVSEPAAPPIVMVSEAPAATDGPAITAACSQHRPLPEPGTHSASRRPAGARRIRASAPGLGQSIHRATAACDACGLTIAGRTVSAGGGRFHPECFTCFHCGELLECVAFYPEPETKREERLCRAREDTGTDGDQPDRDADESLRFYCHLDFHELFSPRCRSCKTPIEGEVIVACGGEWHVGHFFCAQCGDPFDPSKPFVEREGYAWCVNCHANRFSTKCKKCRRPVTETVLKALGAEWHPDCFCCAECGGGFDDGRYFLRGNSEQPVCVRCEETRLKSSPW